ncbi:MAG: ABC transporter permease, partial [Acidobacteria bacterium]|nr:ABC transporter permease [Acidobacteriota bacterium]
MNSLLTDLRYALRKMVREPFFTLVAVLALALGIAANTAMFSVVDSVLLRPLPYGDPDRLVYLQEHQPESGELPVAPANFVDWQKQSKTFEAFTAYVGPEAGSRTKFTLIGPGGDPERLQGTSVTGNFFQLLDVEPAAGRLLTPEDIEANGDQTVMISHRLWQRRFGGDPGIVGKTVVVEGKERTVLGVLPQDFSFPEADVDLWLPLNFEYSNIRRAHFFQVVGRLQPGSDLAAATGEMQALAKNLEQEYPATNSNLTVELMPLRERIVGDTSQTLLLLLGAVGLVLLLTCANVASLMIARATTRQGEMAVRTALGADQGRITGQMLVETLVLAVVAGGVSLVVTRGLITLVERWAPQGVPRLDQAGIDLRVILFTAGVTLLATFLCGLAPVLSSRRVDLAKALREEGTRRGGDHSHRTRNLLVIAEVALALMLVAGTGLMIKSFDRLISVDPGFKPGGALTFGVALPRSSYGEPEQIAAFYRNLLADLRTRPGVTAAGTVPVLPLDGVWWSGDFTLEGMKPFPEGEEPKVQHLEVSTGYFEAMGIPIVEGRSFNESDGADAGPVAVVNQTFVDQFLDGREPLGLQVKFALPTQEAPWVTIVGVSRDVRQTSLAQEVLPEAYVPLMQDPQSANAVVLRTSGDPKTLIGPAREAVAALDPTLPIFDIRTTDELVSGSISRQRFVLRLLLAFALVALFLATLGIYGVTAYTVARRTREIGLRMALGAESQRVAGWVMWRTLRLIVLGVVVGVIGAFGGARLLSNQLYGIETLDPVVIVLVSLLLAVVGALAALLPALRATRIDPLDALRS